MIFKRFPCFYFVTIFRHYAGVVLLLCWSRFALEGLDCTGDGGDRVGAELEQEAAINSSPESKRSRSEAPKDAAQQLRMWRAALARHRAARALRRAR